jgi:hypothetical protein
MGLAQSDVLKVPVSVPEGNVAVNVPATPAAEDDVSVMEPLVAVPSVVLSVAEQVASS